MTAGRMVQSLRRRLPYVETLAYHGWRAYAIGWDIGRFEFRVEVNVASGREHDR